MRSRMDSPWPGRLTRRTATVIISAPDSSCASRMISLDAYLPVPTMSRDVYSLPPRTRVVSVIMLSAPHRSDDLDLVALTQRHRRILRFRCDLAVDSDGGELPAHVEMREQRVDAEGVRDFHRRTVHHDRHK